MIDLQDRLREALADRYRIERELGAGGMATFYLAQDLRHDRQVAVKVLRPELAAVIGAERFLSEIRTAANLQHPNILPLFDSGVADSFLYYVMPYVQRIPLRERLQREKQLPVPEAIRIATEMVHWRVVAKDGAEFAAHQVRSEPARFYIGVGETFDAEAELPPGEYRLTAGNPARPFFVQRMVVR